MANVDIGGEIVADTNAQLQAMYPGNTVTPTQNFEFQWNGSIIEFVQGVTQYADNGLLAALTAAAAPFSQP